MNKINKPVETLYKASKKRDAIYSISTIMLAILILLTITGCDDRTTNIGSVKITDFRIISGNDVLYNDEITFIEAQVTVRDDEEKVAPRQKVSVRSNNNDIFFSKDSEGKYITTATITTDSLGVAKVRFRLRSRYSRDEREALVIAHIGSKTQQDISVKLRSIDGANISDVLIVSSVPNQIAVNQTLQLRARVSAPIGTDVPEGVSVVFSLEKDKLGSFFYIDNPQIEYSVISVPADNSGVATVGWRTGFLAGETGIKVNVGDFEDTVETIVIPGVPRILTLDPDRYSTDISQPAVEITTGLFDSWGNAIKNRSIMYETNLGTVTERATTDSTGYAIALFTPGPYIGIADIEAKATAADSASSIVSIRITSADAAALAFQEEGGIYLNVAGTGGVDSRAVVVELRDASNLLFAGEEEVKFEIVSTPGEVLLDGSSASSVTKPSAGGLAIVTISAGSKSGIVALKASLVDKPTISVTKGNIVIHAGPPTKAAILSPGYDSGTAINAGSWEVILGVLVQDTYNNPITKGTGVWFTLDVPPTSSIYNNVTINTESYIYNVSAQGDSAAGVAYTTMTYHGSLSNLEVPVRIEVGRNVAGEPNLVVTLPVRLPMNGINMENSWQPGFMEWTGTPFVDQAVLRVVTITTYVTDGLGNPIQGAIIHYMENRGFFCDIYAMTNPFTGATITAANFPPGTVFTPPEDPSDFGITPNGGFSRNSAVTGDDGKQRKKYYMPKQFTEAPAPPAEQASNITIIVEGTGQSETIQITQRLWF